VRREFFIAPSKAQHGYLLVAVIAAIGLVVLALGDASVPDAGLIGGLNLLLATGLLAWNIYSSRDRRAHMTLDEEGIWYRDWKIGKVLWPDIAHAAISGSRVQSFLSVCLRDPERFLARLAENERNGLRGNRLVNMPELRVPNGALDEALEEILGAVNANLKRYGAARAQRTGDRRGAARG